MLQPTHSNYNLKHTMKERLRFAPSPTGQVHIGNIRTAIFNWLAARHDGGKFILRIEDTDLERSTREAIDTLLDCMAWLGLDYDEEIMYQTTQAPKHLAAANKLIADGNAYKTTPEEEHSPVYYRIPYHCDEFPFVNTIGPAEIIIAPGTITSINRSGVSYSILTNKGKTAENQACLAGFKDLIITNAANEVIFELNENNLKQILSGEQSVEINDAAKLKFIRREVFYDDVVKGHLAKQLDSMKDFIIVRSDGSPVFHLGNVCDDVTQNVTFIVRGDDHVENTYRHLFMFHTLGGSAPKYGHLPMIVNAQGKPFSKRDGDAFVGDFRDKGVLPEALFNYLSLLGWSPGDNREKMSREELVAAFDITRVQHSPAQFDAVKLANLNGQYIAELPFEDFAERAWKFAEKSNYKWFNGVDKQKFLAVARLMQTRTKLMTNLETWESFFMEPQCYDPKGVKKFLTAESVRDALATFADALGKLPESTNYTDIETLFRKIESDAGLSEFALNQPARVAMCGITVGASIYETIVCIGIAESAARIKKALPATRPA